jgi:hypothetical protein
MSAAFLSPSTRTVNSTLNYRFLHKLTSINIPISIMVSLRFALKAGVVRTKQTENLAGSGTGNF